MKYNNIFVFIILLNIFHINCNRLSLKERVKQYLLADDQPCLGIPAATCKDCASGMPMCDVMEHMCNLNFCHPICTTETWTVTTEATHPGPSENFQDEVNSPLVNRALEAEFKVWGCVERMKCCDKDVMFHWLENHVFQEEYPKPTLPIESCSHFVEDKEMAQAYCEACKKSVKVTTEDIECDERMETPADGGDPSFHSYGAFIQEKLEKLKSSRTHKPYLAFDKKKGEFTIKLKKKPLRTLIPREFPPSLLHRSENQHDQKSHPGFVRLRALLEQHNQERAHIELQTQTKGDGYEVGPPVHKSFYFRCNTFHNAVVGMLPGLEAEFQERVCGCLGCCQDIHCFYDVGVNKVPDIPMAGNTLGFLSDKG